MQEDRIKNHKTEGDRHFTEEGRIAEITVDVVFQATAKMAEEKVTGPEDSIVTEMQKQLPRENITILQIASKTASRGWKRHPVLGRL